jgi:hypothetical protein
MSVKMDHNTSEIIDDKVVDIVAKVDLQLDAAAPPSCEVDMATANPEKL